MSDWSWEKKANNFAGAGYREAALKLEQFGADSIRKAVIDTPDGTVLLETKNGMPRVTPLSSKVEDEEKGPITELLYSDREYYGESPDEEDRVYSYDGLYSAAWKPVKRIGVKVGNKLTKRWLRLSNPATRETPTQAARIEHKAVREAPGDLVETNRAMQESETVRIFTALNRQIAVLSHDLVASVDVVISGKTARLKFGWPRVAYDSTMTPKPLFGAHNPIDVTLTDGRVLKVRASRDYAKLDESGPKLTKGILEITLLEDGQFLEPWSLEVLKSLGEWVFLPGDTPPLFPVPAEFAPAFKGFYCASGLYVDETRMVRIDVAPVATAFAAASAPAFNVNEANKLLPRYFNFNTDSRPNLAVPGTACLLKGDLQFQFEGGSISGGFCCSPGMQAEFGTAQHLYKDPSGRVWRISFNEGVSPTAGMRRLTVVLDKRVDPVYEDKRPTLNRTLTTLDFTPDPVHGASAEATIAVTNLANGKEACAMILKTAETPGDLVYRYTHYMSEYFSEYSATVAIVKVVFSGDGGDDGSGVSATASSLLLWEEYSNTHSGPVSGPEIIDTPGSSSVTGVGWTDTTTTISYSYNEVGDSWSNTSWRLLIGMHADGNTWRKVALHLEDNTTYSYEKLSTTSGTWFTHHEYSPIVEPHDYGNSETTVTGALAVSRWRRVAARLYDGANYLERVFEGVSTLDSTYSGSATQAYGTGPSIWENTSTSTYITDITWSAGGAPLPPSHVEYSQTLINPINDGQIPGWIHPQLGEMPPPTMFFGNTALTGAADVYYFDFVGSAGYGIATAFGGSDLIYKDAIFPKDTLKKRLCYDPRNARVWLAPSDADAGAFY